MDEDNDGENLEFLDQEPQCLHHITNIVIQLGYGDLIIKWMKGRFYIFSYSSNNIFKGHSEGYGSHFQCIF